MRMQILVAGLCAATIIPAVAMAQQTCDERQSTRVAGTLAGAGVGAVAGGAVAGHGNRGQGALIGGAVGALIGNQATKGQASCARAYGFYDHQGAWHASNLARGEATGYFNRDGEWVDGAPRGYYKSDGRWAQAGAADSSSGYYAGPSWVPASAPGYYGEDGRWTPAVSGYYDRSGTWVAGPANGSYDKDGRWLSGQGSTMGEPGSARSAKPQPGYYDQGRWVRGEAFGYYDARGRWIATDDQQRAGSSQPLLHSTSLAPSINTRQAQLAERIDRGARNGRLSRAQVSEARRTLGSIERQERSLRNRQGQLGPQSQAAIIARLDRLSKSLGVDIRETY